MSSENLIQPPRPTGAAIENRRPTGGEQRPSRMPLVTERPAPDRHRYGNFGSQHETTNIKPERNFND
jgi:hypothetical protein